MQIGVDSFAAAISDPATGLTLGPVERMQHLLEEIELADQVGLDVFGIGEHHRAEFLDSAPAVILAAAAAPVTPPRNSSWVCTPSASWERPPSKRRTTFILGTHTPSPRSARNAAGPQLPGHNSTLCADPRVRC